MKDKARQLVERLQSLDEACEPPEELSAQEIRVLDTVGRNGCCVMSGIARAIHLSMSGVTSLIDRLVEKKLVRRDRSSEDRRIVQVELTEEGRALREASLDARARQLRERLKDLSAEEQEQLLSLLARLAA